MITILIYEIRFTADRSIAERFRYWSEKTVNDRGFLIHPYAELLFSGEKGCLLKKIRKKLVFLIYKTVLCRVVL